MKPKSSNRFLSVLRHFFSAQAIVFTVLSSPAMAGTVYWDTNTTTAGSGNADGPWDAATANWNTSSAGTGATAAWIPGDIAQFSAGTDFIGTRIVTVSGTQSLAGIILNSQLTNFTLTGGTLAFGTLQGAINTSAWGTTSGKTFTLASIITGSNGLAVASNGDLTGTGGGNSSVTRLSGVNTFTGDVTITSGLLAYASDSAFGNAANKIILNGGGLLDNSVNVNLARDIQILSGGGTFRAYGGTTTAAWSGAITGTGPINRTDGGTISLTGNLSGYSGTYTNQGGTTRFQTGSNALNGTLTITGGLASIENSATNTYTAVNLNGGTLGIRNNSNALGSLTLPVGASATIAVQTGSSAITLANNITVSGTNTLSLDASGGNLSLTGNITGAGVTVQTSGASGTTTLSGTVNLGTGTLSVGGAQTLAITTGAAVTADTVVMTGTTVANNLNITGGTLTTKYLNIGNATNNSGRVNQSGGTVTVPTGGTGFRIGHWNSGAGLGSSYNLSGGTLDASAITANIGWDGQGDMTVGGGAGSATLKASGIQLDANGDSTFNDTLTVSTLGTAEVGSGGIAGASANDRVILNGGTLKAVSNAAWSSVINANSATTSTLDTNGNTVTLSNNLTGTGTIDLSSATGTVSFSTAGTQTVTPALFGTTAITKLGTGTTTLSGAGNHNGSLTVSAGRLNLSGILASATSTIASGATLGGEGALGGTATFSAGSRLAVDSSTAGAISFSNVSIVGKPTITFDNLPSASQNPVRLFTYTGIITGTASSDLIISTPANFRSAIVTDSGGIVSLDLGNKNLLWNGTTGGQWVVGTANTRWNASEVDAFYWGDGVTFDDTGVSTALTLTGELQPSSITVTSSTKNYTISGTAGNFLSGPTGLAKSGSSTLILNAPNTFTGATALTAGTLQVGDGTNNIATLSAGTASIATGTTLSFFRNGAYPIPNSLSGTGTVAFLGTGVSEQSNYSLSGINTTFNGLLDIRSGARLTVDNSADTGTAAINVASGAGLYLIGSIANAITLNGNGWTESNGQLGALRVGGGGVASGAVTLAGNTRLTAWTGETTGLISGVITDGAGSFGIEKTGTGTLTLVPANTYDGGTVVSFGALNIRNAGSLGTAGVTLGNSGSGTNPIGLYLDTNRTTFTNPITVSSNGSGTVSIGSLATATGTGIMGFTNIILQRSVTLDSNAADRTDYLITSGTGDLTFTGGGRSVMVAASSFTGNVTVNPSAVGGHLQLGTATAVLSNYIPDTANLTVTNFTAATQAEFRLSTQGETINGLSGNGTIDTNSITGTLTVGGAGGGGTFSGDMIGTTLNFAKIGAGTQVLSGANTLTGSITLSGGTLSISGASGVINATSGVNIGSGTTFTLDNTSTANNVNRLRDAGTVTMNGGTFNFSNNGGAVDYTETTGALSIASGVNTITSSQATTPNVSTLTFASLARTSGATVNFTGTGLGVNNQNKIVITGQAVGLIGPWATINGTQLAGYDATKGVTAFTAFTDVTRTDSGTKVIADATANNVQIIEGTGSVVANITLAVATTNINSLVQNANGGTATVALPSQTLRLGTAGGILSWPAMGNLVVGATAGEGTLTAGGSATNVAGDISLVNNSNTGALITINSIIANNGTGVITLNKTGIGTAVLAGASTYTGLTTVSEGTLQVNANNGPKTYTINPSGTLQLGYSTGGAVYGYGVTVNGAGTAATTGLYLQGGRTFNFQSALTLNTSPTTVRGYGTGAAILNGYDTNNTHLTSSAVASGSIFDSNINVNPGAFGYVMNITPGANTATGDVTFQGQLTGTVNGNNAAFRKTGTGSLLLTGASTATAALDIRVGSVILSGGNNRLGSGSSVVVGNGGSSGRLLLGGTSQTLAAILSAGTGTANAIVGGNSTLSTLTISNTSAVTFPSASTTATLGGAGANENNLALAKTGAGTLNLGGTNTYTGGTTVTAGVLSLTTTGALGTTGAITLNGGTLQFTAANTTDYTASGRLRLADGVVSFLDSNTQSISIGNALALGTLGTGGLGKSGAGSLTVTANQTYLGGSSVNGGILVLSYATANGSKLSDSGTLTLGTGTLSLDGGSHEELVGNTVVTGTAIINRTSGTARINLGAITRTASNTLDIAADNIARTSLSNDISGKLPVWITVGGSPSANDGSGNIVAFNGFVNVVRLGGQIPNNAVNNVKIVDGGTSGDVTPATPGTTDAASLLQSATGGPAVVVLGSSDTLRLSALGSISVPSTSGTLTIQNGSLTAGGADNTAGNIVFDAGNDIIVNSPINKNGSANVTITKQGNAALTLAGNNFHVGGTILNAGQLRINNEFALGGAPLTINGGTLDNTSGSPITIGESITQTWNSDIQFIGSNDLSFGGGNITITANRIVTVDNGNLSYGGSINGAFALTKAGSGSLVVGGGNWTGTTTLTGGSFEVPSKINDVAYVVGSGTTLKLGYTTGGAGANTNLKLTGNGTAATTGLYLKGGTNYNANAGIELLSAPTTIRQYGTGLAGIGMWDINGNAITAGAAASGSVIDANIEFTSRGYGNSVNVASGSANATGDLVINGPLNITLAQSGNTLGFYKRGTGSVALNATANVNNVSLRLEGGSVITGAVDAIGVNSSVVSSGGTRILMKGFSQAIGSLSGSGAIVNGSATATVLTVKQAPSLQAFNGDQTFSGLLGGAGTNENNFSLVKTGTSKLTLTATNTYSGNTTVNAGILSISSAFLANASDVLITTGATLELNTTLGTTDTIDELYVDGVPQAPGVYGSLTSTAQFKKAYITGNGTLTVTTGPAGYTSWADANGVTGGTNGDSDNDGILNLVEYALNLNPAASDGATGTFNGTTLSFSKRALAVTNADVTYAIEISTDLGVNDPWTPVSGPGFTNNSTTISYDLPTGPVKNFARFKVTKP